MGRTLAPGRDDGRAEGNGGLDDAVVLDLVDAEHFDASAAFWKVAGDSLVIDRGVAHDHAAQKPGVQVRLVEAHLDSLSQLFVPMREPPAMQLLLRLRMIGLRLRPRPSIVPLCYKKSAWFVTDGVS